MKTPLLTFTLASAIALSGTFNTQAAPKTTPTPAAVEATPAGRLVRPLPFTGKISAVDNAAKTFSTENREKKTRIFEITPETKLTKKNSPATFEDLKIGQEVRGTATPKGNGLFTTENVIIGAREEPKPAPTAAPVPCATPRSTPKSTPKVSKKPHPTPTPTAGRTD